MRLTTRLFALCLVLPLGPQGRAAPSQVAGVGSTLGPDLDSDGDGLSDFRELHKYGTDPQREDSDGDGVPDGDWSERREYAYTLRTRVRVMRPVDVLAANDDYQDARVLDEAREWVELEVVHYPLGTAGQAIQGDAGWRDALDGAAAFLESTATSSWDDGMRATLLDELRQEGLDPAAADDCTLARAAAQRLMARSTFDERFTAFLADYRAGRPVVTAELKGVVQAFEREHGISIEEQWGRELSAQGMFEQRVHGSCTSSAVYLCGGLRAAGVPARIVLVIPVVDINDPQQVRMVETGIRHHAVRATIMKGLRRISGGWVSHTFNEVLVDGRWRRLNYTYLGQPILDENLYGLTIHILTLRDWSQARMGRTVGRRQGLGLRDEVFRTSNPYATLELDDQFGAHAEIANPLPVEETHIEPAPIEQVTIARLAWVASDERPRHLEISRVDMEHDRQHVVLIAETAGLPLERDPLDRFWDEVSKSFELVSEGGETLPASAVRGMWWGKRDGEAYLYYLLRLGEDAREQLVPGATYRLRPTAREGVRFAVAEGSRLVAPE